MKDPDPEPNPFPVIQNGSSEIEAGTKEGEKTKTNPPTRPLSPSEASLHIHTIRIAVHSLGRFLSSDSRSGNHASIYLLVGNGAAIRLDMFKAGVTDTMGTYRVRWCEYEVSKRAVKMWDLKPVQGLIVGNMLAIVEREGRGRYRLTRSGLGCRFWVTTILGDMEKYNYISSQSRLKPAFVKEALRYNYSKCAEPVFDEIVRGTFLPEKTCEGKL